MFLSFGTGIFGMSLAVEPAFVADTDTFFVEATGVCADAFERPGRFDIPIFADIKMVSRPVESPPAVADIQVIFRKLPVLTCSGTVDYYQLYRSHTFPFTAPVAYNLYCCIARLPPVQVVPAVKRSPYAFPSPSN